MSSTILPQTIESTAASNHGAFAPALEAPCFGAQADPPMASFLSPAKLGSWKEIAAYFNRSVRCVQRWERSEALPIHRHFHARAATVYAFPPELETWRFARRTGYSNMTEWGSPTARD
jgi:hypothetical protein